MSGEAFALQARKSGIALFGSKSLHIPSAEGNRRAPRSRAGGDDGRFSHYLGRSLEIVPPLAFAVLTSSILVIAWIARDEGHLTAEEGPGYWLGIAGASIMLLLLIYPLRKRMKILRSFGRVAGWFRLHMVLGIVGPVLIVLHSNFKLGSLNSALALITMLTVVTSGIVGRYLYGKVHKGLYGSQLRMREIGEDLSLLEDLIGREFARDPEIASELHALAGIATATPLSTFAALRLAVFGGIRIRRTRRRVLLRVRAAALQSARVSGISRAERRARIKSAGRIIDTYFAAATKASRLALFERLLSYWHAFHLPLFILLALTTVIHVVAVHLY